MSYSDQEDCVVTQRISLPLTDQEKFISQFGSLFQFKCVEDQFFHMERIAQEGLFYNYSSCIDSLEHSVIITDLFPEEALNAYTKYNMGFDVNSTEQSYFSAQRGGNQGDYREGITVKIEVAAEQLQADPKAVSFILIPNDPDPDIENDAAHKCLQIVQCWLVEDGSGKRRLDLSVTLRAQATEIFPKNIHFIAAIQSALVERLGSKIVAGKLYYYAAILSAGRQENQSYALASRYAPSKNSFDVTALAKFNQKEVNFPKTPAILTFDMPTLKPTEIAHEKNYLSEKKVKKILACLSARPLSKRATMVLTPEDNALELVFASNPAAGLIHFHCRLQKALPHQSLWCLNVSINMVSDVVDGVAFNIKRILLLANQVRDHLEPYFQGSLELGQMFYRTTDLIGQSVNTQTIGFCSQQKFQLSDENLPSSASINESQDIPRIDASSLLDYGRTGRQTPEWARQIRLLEQALVEVGFFTLSHHGLSALKAKEASYRYFMQPSSFKKELLLTRECQFGYSVMEKLFKTEDGVDPKITKTQADPKESFNIPALNSDFLRWPRSTTVFDGEHFRQTLGDYFQRCEQFICDFLPNLAIILGECPDYFRDKMQGHLSALRTLYYPRVINEGEQIRASSHSDFGLLTLLHTFGTPGLQVYTEAGQWVSVTTHQPDDLVVNIGDALSRMSNGTFRSTRHRVAKLVPEERQSMAYFVNFAPSALVEVVKKYRKGQDNLPSITSGEYIMAKNALAHGI